jgi:hypothetical protein
MLYFLPTQLERHMNPRTEGLEEQGPSGVPFVNDPAKPANAGHPAAEPSEDDSEEVSMDDPDIAGADGSEGPQ